MALTPANAEVAITGAVMVGATSAAAPTAVDGTTTGFTDVGLIGEDGVVEAHDEAVDSLKAWQNGQVVRTVKTDGSVTFAFTMLETSAATVELAYETTVTTGSYLIDLESTRARRSFIIDTVDDDELERVYVAEGQVIELGDVVRVNNAIKGYPVTVQAYKHATYGQAKVWSTRLGAPDESSSSSSSS